MTTTTTTTTAVSSVVWLADDNHLVQLTRSTQTKTSSESEIGFLVGRKIQHYNLSSQPIFLILSSVRDLEVIIKIACFHNIE